MRVLVVNAGSSSLKLQILDDHQLVVDLNLQRWSPADGFEPIRSALAGHEHIDAVGHRVVHGGQMYVESTVITDEVITNLESIQDLAPLHLPPALAAIEAARQLLPDLTHVACFDTAFHRSIPAAAATYALPREWNKKWGLRRYGFHGLSHAYACAKGAELLDRPLSELRIVTAHLGAGASLTAIDGGQSVDTTMGFTPLEGLVMATRSGSVDPGLVLWLQRNAHYSLDEITDRLEHGSGLAGLSGTSGDLRDVVALAEAGEPDAVLALAVYHHRLATLTGSMITSMGGIDMVVFTGGIGEHSELVRRSLAKSLQFLGANIDELSNTANGTDRLVSTTESTVALAVVQAREDIQIADEVAQLLAA